MIWFKINVNINILIMLVYHNHDWLNSLFKKNWIRENRKEQAFEID